MTNHIFILVCVLQGIIILWYVRDCGSTESWEIIKYTLMWHKEIKQLAKKIVETLTENYFNVLVVLLRPSLYPHI